jgi:hypothetical protein
MLGVDPIHARFMAGEETRQLIGRHHEINGGDNQQDDAKHGQYELHEVSSSTQTEAVGRPGAGSWPWFIAIAQASARAAGRRQLGILNANGAHRLKRSAHAGALAALAFDDVVALFHQALALAIFAFLLFFDVGPFFIGHDVLPARHLPESP